ncbi:MAG: hypothetical protein U0136_19365 [Bdellovibrionota bacterium]
MLSWAPSERPAAEALQNCSAVLRDRKAWGKSGLDHARGEVLRLTISVAAPTRTLSTTRRVDAVIVVTAVVIALVVVISIAIVASVAIGREQLPGRKKIAQLRAQGSPLRIIARAIRDAWAGSALGSKRTSWDIALTFHHEHGSCRMPSKAHVSVPLHVTSTSEQRRAR